MHPKDALLQGIPTGIAAIWFNLRRACRRQKQSSLIAEAQVVVGSDSQIGLVILEPSSNEILVGMDFLRHFKLALILASYGLALIQESEFDKIVAEP